MRWRRRWARASYCRSPFEIPTLVPGGKCRAPKKLPFSFWDSFCFSTPEWENLSEDCRSPFEIPWSRVVSPDLCFQKRQDCRSPFEILKLVAARGSTSKRGIAVLLLRFKMISDFRYADMGMEYCIAVLLLRFSVCRRAKTTRRREPKLPFSFWDSALEALIAAKEAIYNCRSPFEILVAATRHHAAGGGAFSLPFSFWDSVDALELQPGDHICIAVLLLRF